jgi:hypothetical protein
MAMPADSCAAQRFHSNSPRPAVRYANAAMKLNQRTNGTMLPADTLISGRPNNTLPPSKTVTPPNATARIPAATAHLGRPDTPSVISKTPCRSNVWESQDRVIRMIPRDQFAARCFLQNKRHHERHKLPEAVGLDRHQLAPSNRFVEYCTTQRLWQIKFFSGIRAHVAFET